MKASILANAKAWTALITSLVMVGILKINLPVTSDVAEMIANAVAALMIATMVWYIPNTPPPEPPKGDSP